MYNNAFQAHGYLEQRNGKGGICTNEEARPAESAQSI